MRELNLPLRADCVEAPVRPTKVAGTLSDLDLSPRGYVRRVLVRRTDLRLLRTESTRALTSAGR